MNFQRILMVLVVLLAAGLAGSFYMNWKTLGQLRTVKAFVEVLSLPMRWPPARGRRARPRSNGTAASSPPSIGLNSVKFNKDTIIASYTLVADSVYCDYDPVKKKADIGSNFLERE